MSQLLGGGPSPFDLDQPSQNSESMLRVKVLKEIFNQSFSENELLERVISL